MKKKNYFIFIFSLIMGAFIINSCEKENIEQSETTLAKLKSSCNWDGELSFGSREVISGEYTEENMVSCGDFLFYVEKNGTKINYYNKTTKQHYPLRIDDGYDARTDCTPAVAIVGSYYYVIWDTYRSDDYIWYCRFTKSGDRLVYNGRQRHFYHAKTKLPPTVVYFNGKLYMYYVTVDGSDQIWYDVMDDPTNSNSDNVYNSIRGHYKVPLLESKHGPAATTNGSKIYLFNRAKTNYIECSTSSNGSSYSLYQNLAYLSSYYVPDQFVAGYRCSRVYIAVAPRYYAHGAAAYDSYSWNTSLTGKIYSTYFLYTSSTKACISAIDEEGSIYVAPYIPYSWRQIEKYYWE